jgi:hypothetical protein
VTAQRVAAHRLTLDRIPAPYGHPGADDALARDVAAAAARPPGRCASGSLAAHRRETGAVRTVPGRGSYVNERGYW